MCLKVAPFFVWLMMLTADWLRSGTHFPCTDRLRWSGIFITMQQLPSPKLYEENKWLFFSIKLPYVCVIIFPTAVVSRVANTFYSPKMHPNYRNIKAVFQCFYSECGKDTLTYHKIIVWFTWFSTCSLQANYKNRVNQHRDLAIEYWDILPTQCSAPQHLFH